MSYALCANGETVLPAQAIKLSKLAIIFTSIVRCYATFIDIMQNLVCYSRAPIVDCSARFVDMRIMNTMKDIMFSIF